MTSKQWFKVVREPVLNLAPAESVTLGKLYLDNVFFCQTCEDEDRFLENGDVEEALNAASQIGDDHLQKAARGYAVPDTFTHGTSAQRVKWFKTGLQAKSLDDCDTFKATNL